MNAGLPRRRFLEALVAIPAGLGASRAAFRAAAAEPRHAVRPGEMIEGGLDAGGHSVTFGFRGRPVLAYAAEPSLHKPYVRELRTLRGENVLRDAPADHLHHHGLMFAVRVNGVNFWEERPPAGRQVAAGAPVVERGSGRDGLPWASLRQRLHWLPPGEEDPAAALLIEEREVRLTVDAGLEEVAVAWTGRFEVGPSVERAVVHGTDYNGLGLRLPEAFDHVAEFANSARLSYSAAQTFDVRPAAWTSASGRMEGREVQVALASHPANPGRQSFFSMRNAFAYLAAIPELAREPLEFGRGGRFVFRHLLLALPAHQNPDYLDRRFGPWLSSP